MAAALILFFILIAAVLGWLAIQNGSYHISRSRIIKTSPEVAFEAVSDFKTWPEWTPWLAHERDCKIDYSDTTKTEGSWYSWNGKIIGAGKMTHDKFTAPNQIESRIEFLRPMRSKSDVYWKFNPVEGGTEVTWGMRGKMPFFFRWMAAKMDQWVGKDYEIGLNNLAMTLNDNSNAFDLSFDGLIESPAQYYISTAFSGTFAELPNAMQKAYPELMAAVEDNELDVAGEPFTLYNKVNIKKDFLSCDIAVPVSNKTNIDGFTNAILPARTYSRTTLKGDYTNLELAWHSAFSNLRMNKLRFHWKHPILERYITNPRTSEGMELVTYLDIPLK
uniref:GyrI-like small molecule binding domain-containing protein n=1 Tax=uncultured Thiotrichaceae bacterium TaxID=298394 RepID=A0A6S6UFX9_9GAMM|nr:MAG: Unknown protein [uncultured Thiotrichaceae bacterium]